MEEGKFWGGVWESLSSNGSASPSGITLAKSLPLPPPSTTNRKPCCMCGDQHPSSTTGYWSLAELSSLQARNIRRFPRCVKYERPGEIKIKNVQAKLYNQKATTFIGCSFIQQSSNHLINHSCDSIQFYLLFYFILFSVEKSFSVALQQV